ncbi:hypothetical protein MUO74_00180 [Candidatus Bathyarchaeota archaeon]|nr:hypothetical protein [Candidatus Bathyarchaeota archaeon]
MKLKEIGIAIVLALAITMAFNVVSVRAITGDLNSDGKVDLLDIVVAAVAFGTHTGDPTYNPDADINSDGVIDVFDLVAIAINYA